MIELRAGRAQCIVSPDEGGRVASLRVGDIALLIERPHDGSAPDPMSWGCYPMVPWAGRVRRGQFTFDGRDYQLPINLAPHSIHGTVFTRSWHVDLVEPHSVTMQCTFGPSWPFGGFVTQRLTLHDDALSCELTITAGDHRMPAQLGWHPWFTKPQSSDLLFAQMYARDPEGIPSGAIVVPTTGPWDDCFTHPLAPLQLRYVSASAAELVVTLSSDCDHWVVYDQPRHATCVEPQSGPPDAFNLAPRVLEPGQTLQRTMNIRWTDPLAPAHRE